MSEMVVIDGDGRSSEKLPAATTPTEMLAQALQSGAAPETMEKLMALQERWEAGQARKAFDFAMSQLRSNMPTVIKTTEGHGYKYEQLADITEAVSEQMAALGLSFRWRTESNEKSVKVTCVIAHKDGHYEETSLIHLPDKTGSKNDIQALGSAVTYLQRYTLKAAVGIAAAKDDDGERVRNQTEDAPIKTRQVPKGQSRELYTELQQDIDACGDEEMLTQWGCDRSQDLNALPDDWQKELRQRYRRQLNELRKEAAEKETQQEEYNDDQPPF